MEPVLIFNITNQEIERTDEFTVVESSVSYLKARFNTLTDDWDGMIITGVFIMEDGTPVPSLADENGICSVPETWLVKQNGYVGAIGSNGTAKITTRAAKVRIREKGYKTEIMDQEAQSYYDQLIRAFSETKEFAQEQAGAAAESERSSEAWAHGHENYPDRDEDNAAYYASKAREDATRIEADRKETAELSQQAREVSSIVTANLEQVQSLTSQAQTAARNALQSEQTAKTSQAAAEAAREGAEAAEGRAELFANQTAEDRSAAEAAKTLVMQTGREVSDNKASVEQTVESFALAHQQAVADVNNAGQLQTKRVQENGEQAVDDIITAKANALSEITTVGETQTKAVNDAGAAKTAEVNEAGTTQLKAVNDAGTAQVAAVTAEGTVQVVNVQEAAAEIIADRDQIELNRQNLLKTAIKRTASGKTITLSDSAEMPFVGMRQYGHTTQDGIPTPENPVELVSAGNKGNIETRVTGKNLIMFPYVSNFETLNGITYAISDDGVVTAGGTTDSGTNFNLCSGLTLHPGTYTLSGMNEFSGMNLLVYDSDKKLVLCILEAGEESAMFTVDKKYSFVMVYLNVGKAGVKVEGKAYPMLQHGTESTAYEPYKAQPLTMLTPNGLPGIPVSSGGNYTDENGQQWVADYRDWERGVDVQMVRLLDITPDYNWSLWNEGFYFDGGLSDIHSANRDFSLATHFRYGSKNSASPTFIFTNTGNSFSPIFYNTGFETINEWKAWIEENELQILYILAEPIETPIPADELAAYHALHTNNPTTVISNDEEAWTEVEYAIDTETGINAKVQEGNIMTDDTTGKKYILGMKDGLLTVYEVIE